MKALQAVPFVLLGVLAQFPAPLPVVAQDQGSILPITASRTSPSRSSGPSVRVPPGISQVVMERREGTGWRPVMVRHLNPDRLSAVLLPLSLPRGTKPADLRIIAYSRAKFPAGFSEKQRVFAQQDRGSVSNRLSASVLAGSPALALATVDAGANSTAANSTLAEESDIWRIAGNQMFFFNQFRGLQVFDLSDPASPVRTGTLRLPASGEQMYVLGERASAVALVGQSNHRATAGQPALFLVRIQNGKPSLAAEIPFRGQIQDSRLIGTRLYLLTSYWADPSVPGEPDDTGDGIAASAFYPFGTGRSVLICVDVSDPFRPRVGEPMVFPGIRASLQAAGEHLLVSTEAEWYTGGGQINEVHLIRMNQPDGAPVLAKSFRTFGEIADKFKMSVVNGAVAAVTHHWNQAQRRRETWVETYPVEGPSTSPLARFELTGARNETLHATRFDGARLYVVTFLRVDPLFVLDLSDPAQPVLGGTLEIPGWSTYIEPLGDRLLAVGVEDWRVTVSLFDVADILQPALLSRIPLGPDGTHSWSEANYDEKAVEFLPQSNLVFVPFQSWTSSGYQSVIQAVQLERDGLTLGQAVPHSGQARRGTLVGNHLVSISGEQLIVLPRDATDGSETVLPLSWNVDRVIPVGDHLLQVDDGPQSWFGYYPALRIAAGFDRNQAEAVIRVTPAADPDALIEEIVLGQGRVAGVSRKGDILYLALWQDLGATAKLRTWVLNVRDPEAIQTVAGLDQPVAGAPQVDLDQASALWPREDLLVWHLPGLAGWSYWDWPILIGRPAIAGESVSILPAVSGMQALAEGPGVANSAPQSVGGTLANIASLTGVAGGAPVSGKGTLAAVSRASVAFLPKPSPSPRIAALLFPIQVRAGTPVAGAALRVNANRPIRQAGGAIAENGFVFFSHSSIRDVRVEPVSLEVQRAVQAAANVRHRWWLESFLNVVDFRSDRPVLRGPVSIPGRLLSVNDADAQGAILLTDAETADGNISKRSVQALAYDGISAWQVDQLLLDLPTYTPSASNGKRLFFADNGKNRAVISVIYDPATGKIRQAGSWTTQETVAELSVVENLLLASGYGSLELATINAADLAPHGTVYDTPVNLWLRVSRTFTSPLGLWIPAGQYGVEFLPWGDTQP